MFMPFTYKLARCRPQSAASVQNQEYTGPYPTCFLGLAKIHMKQICMVEVISNQSKKMCKSEVVLEWKNSLSTVVKTKNAWNKYCWDFLKMDMRESCTTEILSNPAKRISPYCEKGRLKSHMLFRSFAHGKEALADEERDQSGGSTGPRHTQPHHPC